LKLGEDLNELQVSLVIYEDGGGRRSKLRRPAGGRPSFAPSSRPPSLEFLPPKLHRFELSVISLTPQASRRLTPISVSMGRTTRCCDARLAFSWVWILDRSGWSVADAELATGLVELFAAEQVFAAQRLAFVAQIDARGAMRRRGFTAAWLHSVELLPLVLHVRPGALDVLRIVAGTEGIEDAGHTVARLGELRARAICCRRPERRRLRFGPLSSSEALTPWGAWHPR